MSKPIDKAQSILSEKGLSLSRRDFEEMQSLFAEVEVEEWEDVARLMEGVALIVNDPAYSGDMDAID